MTTVDNPKVSQTSGKSEDPKQKGFFNRPRAGGKSIWDWMQLLIIPFVLIIVGSFFSFQQAQTSLQVSQKQHEADQQQALDQQQAATLQTYIDNIQDLLLNHHLLGSKPDDNVTILARARTLTALQGLDPRRKGRLVQFLYEAKLIGYLDYNGQPHNSIIDLSYADIAGAVLAPANVSVGYVEGTNEVFSFPIRVSLIGANLSYANLSNIDLSNVDLSKANFTGANLNHANFHNAELQDAELFEANLSDANLTQQQLGQAGYCKGALLPQGLTCNNI